jgi:hypothetical protein
MNLPSGLDYIFDGPAVYQITVQGTIASGWSSRMEGMSISRIFLEDGTPLTILTGELADQAALTGVLNTIYEMHLPLIAVNKLLVASFRKEQLPPEN